MPSPRFKEGNSGRPTGSKNKYPSTVKEAVLNAFLELQKSSKHNIVAFGQRYPRDFYNIASRLIPTEVRQEITVPEGIKLQFITDPGCKPITDDNQTDPGNPDFLGEQSGL
jgi:hypothetical protein